jgi:hypothetical protein
MTTKVPLSNLDPRWLVHEGRRVGLIFLCPEKPTEGRKHHYQSSVFEPLDRQTQWKLFNEALGDEYAYTYVQGCTEGHLWSASPDLATATFDNLTVHPSIDGSPGGLWHGWIRNGNAEFL